MTAAPPTAPAPGPTVPARVQAAPRQAPATAAMRPRPRRPSSCRTACWLTCSPETRKEQKVTSTNPTAGLLPASAADTFTSAGDSTKSAAGVLGKDDFLKLLVGQLQNQDPMAPSDDQQWIGQMAQMTELEQVTNIASSSSKTVNALNRSGNLALIGHTV